MNQNNASHSEKKLHPKRVSVNEALGNLHCLLERIRRSCFMEDQLFLNTVDDTTVGEAVVLLETWLEQGTTGEHLSKQTYQRCIPLPLVVDHAETIVDYIWRTTEEETLFRRDENGKVSPLHEALIVLEAWIFEKRGAGMRQPGWFEAFLYEKRGLLGFVCGWLVSLMFFLPEIVECWRF